MRIYSYLDNFVFNKISMIFGVLCVIIPLFQVSADELRKEGSGNLSITNSKEVFRAFMNEYIKDPLSKCSFDSDWLRDPVSYSVAKKYLKINIYADVVAAYTDVSVDSLFDVGEKEGKYFCKEADADKLWKEMIDKTIDSKDKIGDNSNYYGSAYFKRYKISMPIFDNSWTFAVFVVSYEKKGFLVTTNKADIESSRIYGKDGTRYLPIVGATHTFVFKKIRGKWLNVDKFTDSVLN